MQSQQVTESNAPSQSSKIADSEKQNDKRYIVGKNFDWIFFILSPIAAVIIGSFIGAKHDVINKALSPNNLFIQDNLIDVIFYSFTMAHPIVTIFRSHGNKEIFKQFPYRFTIIPIAIYMGLVLNNWFFSVFTIVLSFWDIYHCSLQTFGLGRIYDAKLGNDPQVGRSLDYWLNLMIYSGPLFAGGVFLDHFSDLGENWLVLFSGKPPIYHEVYGEYIKNIILPGYILFLCFYIYKNLQYKKAGHQISMLKVYLYGVTGAVSIWANMFNSFGNAIAIMNFFHSVQYYAIVYAMEKNNMSETFGFAKSSFKKHLVLALLFGLSAVYGCMVNLKATNLVYWVALFQVVSFTHFWYDGFIWSVRKKHV
jgi:hypothetical protein